MDAPLSSTIAGYCSVLVWIFVFLPQLYENYHRKSGEGLSLVFLYIWLAGDIFSMIGVMLEKLMMTMFLLSLWYTVADACLIWQVIYYKNVTHYQKLKQDENEQTTSVPVFWMNFAFFFIVSALSLLSCYFYYSESFSTSSSTWYNGLSQWMGWISTVLYMGSRLPQIIKNWRHQSTEGLSFGMFACALLGNILSTLAIFLKSTEREFILKNLPWITGSLGTIVFDIVVVLFYFSFLTANTQMLRNRYSYNFAFSNVET
ncbi:PQ loop repeat-domain-containing protein [Sporodiniella umbellata]|nr:PQ loop repeat-domain-containing protein [Sporodiniella umbellata]